MTRNFIIIGMDDNREPFFPPEVLQHIREGKVFSGGLRHREIVEKLLPEGAEWISITVPLDNVFAQYENIFADFEKKAYRLSDRTSVAGTGQSTHRTCPQNRRTDRSGAYPCYYRRADVGIRIHRLHDVHR